ncbi:MAG: hypothetical protein EGR97_12160 [Clostridiales bacterium]|nr:hypothetical protein [Clostridiales bacterium]
MKKEQKKEYRKKRKKGIALGKIDISLLCPFICMINLLHTISCILNLDFKKIKKIEKSTCNISPNGLK